MMTPLNVDGRYRTVEESRVVELLLLYGWIHQLRSGESENSRREAQAYLDRLVQVGLPFQQGEDGIRRFDHTEAVNFAKWIGARGMDDVWEKRFVTTGRELVRQHYPMELGAGACPDPASLPPQRFTVMLQREFNLDLCNRTKPVRLCLPLPLEDAGLRDLTVAPLLPFETECDFSVAAGRLDVRLPELRERNVTFGVEVKFTAYPLGADTERTTLSDADLALYSRPNEGLVQVNSRICALATKLSGSTQEPWITMRRFWDFILDTLACGLVHYDLLNDRDPAAAILTTGWSDCQLLSVLLVALCRAKGIPARIVSGYLLYPASPTDHYWAEVWIDGAWRPFDSVSSDLSACGRDGAWRDHFFGRLDYRMKTQCLPRLFHVNASLRLPPAWNLIWRPVPHGVEAGYYAAESGVLVYRERCSVRRS